MRLVGQLPETGVDRTIRAMFDDTPPADADGAALLRFLIEVRRLGQQVEGLVDEVRRLRSIVARVDPGCEACGEPAASAFAADRREERLLREAEDRRLDTALGQVGAQGTLL